LRAAIHHAAKKNDRQPNAHNYAHVLPPSCPMQAGSNPWQSVIHSTKKLTPGQQPNKTCSFPVLLVWKIRQPSLSESFADFRPSLKRKLPLGLAALEEKFLRPGKRRQTCDRFSQNCTNLMELTPARSTRKVAVTPPQIRRGWLATSKIALCISANNSEWTQLFAGTKRELKNRLCPPLRLDNSYERF
jgi:hypothetical protein